MFADSMRYAVISFDKNMISTRIISINVIEFRFYFAEMPFKPKLSSVKSIISIV